jgi:hypothetical protein
MARPDIYDQLAKEPLSDLTVTQLNSGSKVTAIDQATIDYWRGPITLARIVQSSRTYSHGIVIPEASGIEVIPIAAGEAGFIQPPGSQVWTIQGIEGTGQGGAATCSLSWFDGSSQVVIDSGQSFSTGGNDFEYSTTPPVTAAQPLTVTNSLYLAITETGGAQAVIFNVAIHKVSL